LNNAHPKGERLNEMTWQELIDTEVGIVLQHGTHSEIEYYIVRGSVSVVAYIRIPEGSAYLDEDYDEVGLHVHGGLTYKGPKWWKGDVEGIDESLYFGWDYGHWRDRCFFDEPYRDPNDTEWTDDLVLPEVLEACEEFARFIEYENAQG
jgi:hypothetical protein